MHSLPGRDWSSAKRLERWPPEPTVGGSSPSWRTRLNSMFSMRRLPIMEAFVVCVNWQMWTKRDKNRTQNRTQFLGDILGLFCIISCKQKPSRVMLWKVLVFLSPVCFFILLTYWISLWDSWRFVFSSDADADAATFAAKYYRIDQQFRGVSLEVFLPDLVWMINPLFRSYQDG